MTEAAILCVDDDVIVLDSLRRQIMGRLGQQYLCEVAENVDEAWEVIEELIDDEIQILVIVSDWLMPGVKGDEFLIQVHQRFPGIVKVLLSGQVDRDAVERVQAHAELHRYLSKPWQEDELIETIMYGLKDAPQSVVLDG